MVKAGYVSCRDVRERDESCPFRGSGPKGMGSLPDEEELHTVITIDQNNID